MADTLPNYVTAAAERVERFNEAYRLRTANPTCLSIERRLCGCDYGSTSWTTRDEADVMLRALNISDSSKALDIGSGAGWPGLYFAKESGCDQTLSDLPYDGLAIANGRADEDGMTSRVRSVVANADKLPFPERHFDAISHSDVLCCLEPKLEVLNACRRTIADDGVMAFSVIRFTDGHSESERERAIAGSPEFTESVMPYEEMLNLTGWSIRQHMDLTEQYLKTAIKLRSLEEESKSELTEVYGEMEFNDLLGFRDDYISAIKDGLTRRDLFVVTPT